MSKYIKVFDTVEQYNAYSGGTAFTSPNISYIKSTDETKYDDNGIKHYTEPCEDTFRVVAKEVDYSSGVTDFVAATNFKWQFVMKEIVIPDGVKQLEMSFDNFTKLEKITLPSTLTKFKNDQTFYYCNNLKELIIPSGVTEIPYKFAAICVRLEKLEFGNNITTIGERAFERLDRINSITFNQTTPPTIASSSFRDSSYLIYVPSEFVELYKSATNWSVFADRIQAIPTN